MPIMQATTCQQFKMTTTYYVFRVDSATLRTFMGCVEALGEWGAVTAAQERFGLHSHYEIRKWKNGGRVASTW